MTLSVFNRQRRVPIDLPWLRRFAALAGLECLAHSDDGRFGLRALEEIEVTIISDSAIARVHLDFMNIPGPTDVITFEHGEILVSADTARDRAAEFTHTIEEELALYTVHGLLHLNGFDDTNAQAARRMHNVQHRLWQSCLSQLQPPTTRTRK